MSDTPRTDVAEHNMGSIVEPHYVVDADFSRYLERELVEAREQLRLCNVDQLTTAAELAEAQAALAEPAIKESLTVQRPWVGLTDEEITKLHHEIKAQLMGTYKTEDIYRAIETKLREKNT